MIVTKALDSSDIGSNMLCLLNLRVLCVFVVKFGFLYHLESFLLLDADVEEGGNQAEETDHQRHRGGWSHGIIIKGVSIGKRGEDFTRICRAALS